MKSLATTIMLLITATACFSQRVGIGTVTPAARLHVIDSNVVFTGPLTVPDTTNVNPPSQGAGSRVFWYPQKAAFRVGAVTGTQWNKINIGRYSFGSGYNSRAQGDASTAMGAFTHAIGDSSVALGSNTYAFGIASIAAGTNTRADAHYSTAIGANSQALGTYAMAIGNNAIAASMYSTALGSNTIALGENATAIGNTTTASNWSATAMGFNTIASGLLSHAMGNSTMAQGDASTAMGNFTTAAGVASTAMGFNTTAWGFYSTAMGLYSYSKGPGSVAMGNRSIAEGDYSVTMGERTIAKFPHSLVIGRNNDTTATGSLFEVGNGSHSTSRNNALTVLGNGFVGFGTAHPQHQFDIFIASSGGGIHHPFTSVGIEHNGTHYIDMLTTDDGETGILFGNKTYWGADGGIVYQSVNTFTDSRSLYFRAGSGTRMKVYPNGNAWVQGTLTQASDARLKKDIAPLSNVMASLRKMNGYTYYWKDEDRDKDQQVGLIAQELQKVYPQLVKQNDQGDLSINYSGMIPLLLEALKELQNQVDELKQRLH